MVSAVGVDIFTAGSLRSGGCARESIAVGSDLILILVVVGGLAFDFTSGFHDTANAVATSIATGALKPRVAVLMSACPELRGCVYLDQRRRNDRQGDRESPGPGRRRRAGARLGRVERRDDVESDHLSAAPSLCWAPSPLIA
jgi:hypothetical protein